MLHTYVHEHPGRVKRNLLLFNAYSLCYSPCVASPARKPTGEAYRLGGSVLEEAHPCFPCFAE